MCMADGFLEVHEASEADLVGVALRQLGGVDLQHARDKLSDMHNVSCWVACAISLDGYAISGYAF